MSLNQHFPGAFIFSEKDSEPRQSSVSLYSLLEDYIIKGYDFGTAYAYLRPYWHSGMDAKAVAKELKDRETLDWEMRRDVLVGKKIINPQVPPRRVWDLYSNRMVPWWVARRRPQPISHAWMDESERSNVWTRINGLECPVPIPKDANLDLIRIEMLNMGAEYAWLDVLCLRQPGAWWKDCLRKKEWKVDVPTIGNVYHGLRVVCYMNGLGRPFSFKEDDFKSDRSWFKRAWTLQEACINPIIGGDMGDDGDMQEEVRRKFRRQLRTLERISRSNMLKELDTDVFNPLSHMQKRVSTNSVDKIAGLVYLLYSKEIPAYYETQSDEDAWTGLVNVMWSGIRAQLFFRYPEPGNSGKSWRPSWRQVMAGRLPLPNKRWWDEHVYRDEKMDVDLYYGLCIESAFVQGLDEISMQRAGELLVNDGSGTEYTFQITADHQYSIPADSYMLLGIKPPFPGEEKKQYWVMGKRLLDQRFRKLSIFRIPDMEEAKKLNYLATKTEISLA